MMKKIAYLIGLSIVLTACGEDEEVLPLPKVGEVTEFVTMFEDTEFSDPTHLKLLKELDICKWEASDTSSCATCTPENFKFFPIKEGAKIEDAFMVLVKATTVLKGSDIELPVRHLLVLERENGKLVNVNGFRGNLYATRVSATGRKDLIVRFYIPSESAYFNCLFVWGDKKYKFESVEAIHGGGGTGNVKAEHKEEISKDIYQLLMQNGMLF
jgi:hypothetical protein